MSKASEKGAEIETPEAMARAMLTRAERACFALRMAGFLDTAEAIESGEPVYPRALIRMLRWAVRHYGESERPAMARALKYCKAWVREKRGESPESEE